MPALNIIATQETVLNSGSSSSPPSGMLPKRPAASQMTKATNAEASTTNSQPMLRTVQSSAVPDAVPRLLVSRKPQATNADGQGGRDAEDDLVDAAAAVGALHDGQLECGVRGLLRDLRGWFGGLCTQLRCDAVLRRRPSVLDVGDSA